ncbi:uncharacterized protein LOC135139824, partial [Zophobas morio]|uniref:uncharacterized protein LOC135122107 n=1 Tax=Zophobas morio TaxID=2755281 RepID=UPI003083D1A9
MACNHICSGCNNPVSASCGIACDLCKQFSHFNCLGIKQEEISTINRLHLHSPHLKILCVICIDVFNTPPLSPSEASPLNAENPFLKYVHTIVSHELKPIRHQLESLQHSINTTSHPINENLSYANKLKNASECSVIIKPKNSSQTVKQTKSDVLHSIKPLSSDIEISSVKSVSNGGLVIKCANKLHSEKLLDIASNKLPDTYNIKKTPLILPRLRFVGIPEGLDKNDIATYALTQNPHLFHKDSICEVKKIWSTSKSENTLQAECLVDADSYKKLLDTGHLLIGLNGCTVYDAVTVLRCFKCNAFNHGSSQSKIIKLIKKKDSLWKKFKKSGLLSDREEFTQYRKLVKKEIRVAYGNFVAEAESNIKSDPKEFWKFVKLKKGNSGVPCNMTYLNKTVSGVNNRDSMSYNNFSVTEISEDEVFLKIKNLKSNNTAGPDSIPAFLIKDCVGIFSKPLTYLYNIILSTQTFPDHWKVSKIIPLFKKDDKSVIENYRPISLLNNFAKIFESLLHDTIYYQIKHHLSDAQHGFVQGRSTVTNLMTISQDLASNLDNGYHTDVVYTDFSKAFDRLDHAILLRKLLEFGFSEKLYLLFTSYITERVPQGSVLGPLIFNIFINDVVNDIRSSVLLYADDMKLYRRITSIQDCLVLQSDLDKVHSWCSKNLLQLNYKKCYLLSFTLLRVLIVFDYTLNNNIILRQSQ